MSNRNLILSVVLVLGGFPAQSKASLYTTENAPAINTNWQATLTAASGGIMAIDGGIVANQSISDRAPALNAEVALPTNDITMPETSTLLTGALALLPFGAYWLRRSLLRRKQTAS